MKTNWTKPSFSNSAECDFISPVGLVIATCMLIITLTVGTFSYRHGLEAGRYDAQHDIWNAGYVSGHEDGTAQCFPGEKVKH